MVNITNRRDTKCCGGCGLKGNFLHAWWDCKLVKALWKTVWSFLKNLKIDLLYDSTILLLGIYLKEIKLLSGRDICTPYLL